MFARTGHVCLATTVGLLHVPVRRVEPMLDRLPCPPYRVLRAQGAVRGLTLSATRRVLLLLQRDLT